MTNLIEIQRGFKRNDGVKLPKKTLNTFSGDSSD